MKRSTILGTSLFVLGVAVSLVAHARAEKDAKPVDKAMCEEMMQQHMGMMDKDHAGMMGKDKDHAGMMGKDKDHAGMMGKGHMGMMGKDMPKECMEMMQGEHMASGGMSGDRASRGKVHKGTGIVKSVDPASGKVTLQHEPIQSMRWPEMTMGFAVKDKRALGELKPGQKVEFAFVQEGSNYLITSIR